MAVYADYTYYSETFLGTAIALADFERLALRASAQIDRLTFGQAAAIITADTDAEKVAAIKMATCAVAEAIQSVEASPEVSSERVGQHSVTYHLGKATPDQVKISDAARLWLAPTGLMYRGVDAIE